jgi:hypothetical protein
MNAGMNGLDVHETRMMYKCQRAGRGTARERDSYAPAAQSGVPPDPLRPASSAGMPADRGGRLGKM